MIKNIVLGCFFICTSINIAVAEPIINRVDGIIIHKGTINISGEQFGSKVPAAPLIWDDCEDETVNTFPREKSNTSSLVGYSSFQPADSREGEDIPGTHELKYRSVGQRPVSEIVMGPHNRSTKYLMGGHWEDSVGRHSGRSVQITIPSKENYDNDSAHAGGFKPTWYANWYYRLNPDWPSCGNYPNHKYAVIQSDISAYGGPTYPNDFNYQNFSNGQTPCQVDDALLLRNSSDIGPNDDLTADGNNQSVKNPKYDWVKIENYYGNDPVLGQLIIKFNNIRGWGAEGLGTWFTDKVGQGIGSLTLGGYYRQYLDVAGFQNNDAFRFFDDIYVDSTFSRVVLTNNSNYDDATIIEPQIPSAWNGSSITCAVNLGRLPDNGIVYLFAFDNNNNRNAVGFEVTVGEGSSSPKAPSLFQNKK